MNRVHLVQARSSGGYASEAALVDALLRCVRRDWPTHALATEVRSHGRCRADVCLRVRDIGATEHAAAGILIAIEAKLTDSRRAVRQALLNRYAVHGSFIAMPSQRTTNHLAEIAQTHGLGLLGVDNTGVTIVVPAVSGSPDPVLLKRMSAQLQPTRARGRTRISNLLKPTEPGQDR